MRSRERWSGMGRGWGGAALLCCVVLVSCAPAGPGQSGGAAGANGAEPRATAPKTLRIAMQAQAERSSGIFGILVDASLGGSASFEHELMFHSDLTTLDPQSTLQPRLAVAVPSINDSSWQVFPDGRMELTWKLRPNVLWHDGTPLKADDFVFGTDVARNATLATAPRALGTKLLTEIVAVDDTTLVVRYPQPFVNANLGTNTPALPRHILGPVYERGDRQELENHPYWTTQFVGLGPYRVGVWERSSFLEGLAFDKYFLGRPKIDRLIVRYYGDVNTMIAALLSNDIDVLPAGAQLDTGQLLVIRNAWQGENKGTVMPVPKGTRNIIPQMRDPNAPWARDVRFRQAIAHSVDRQLIVDTLQDGLTTVAHTSITPELLAFKLLEERGLAKFNYDSTRAERLLNDLGWTRGPNRMFQNATGQPLIMDVTASNQADNIKEIEALSAQWTQFGIQSAPVPFPPAASNVDEIRATYPAMLVWPASSLNNAIEGFNTEQIGSDRTRWRGRNYGGYTSPAYDRLYAEFSTTLDATKSQSLIADMMKVVGDDVAAIPMYYAALGLAFEKRVVGPGAVAPNQAANAWNIHDWDLR